MRRNIFLVGQERSFSDNFQTVVPRQFWNPPGPDLSVINLHGSQPLAAALREHGWYTGNRRDDTDDIDKSLRELFQKTENNPAARVQELRQWIMRRQWEVGGDTDLICTIWHPQATPKLVKAASVWPVYEVTAKTVKEALSQIPRKLRKPCLFEFA